MPIFIISAGIVVRFDYATALHRHPNLANLGAVFA